MTAAGNSNGVQTMGDFDASDPWHVETRIEREPFLSQIDFTVGVKIHGGTRVEIPDVRQMTGHVARGQIEGAA